MSTRALSVKTFNINNKHHQQAGPSPSAHAMSKPATAVNKKNHTIQQPKKNSKVQIAPKNNKRRNHKKAIVSEDDSLSFSSSSSSSSSSEDDMTISKPNMNKRAYNNNKRNTSPNFEYKSLVDQVYAGPTFNNAPAPSALPIPAFNARGSPINQPLIVNPSFQQQSMDLMNLITPQKVVTVYELEKTNLALSEIQRGLRSMLKIES